MKNIFKIIIVSLFVNLCHAQSPIINLSNKGISENGAYYKDIDNFLNRFEGTWLYTQGNTTFKLMLKKKTMLYNNRYYTDCIVGGYEYFENGVLKINNLSDYYANYTEPLDFKVSGSRIIQKVIVPECYECDENELRLELSIREPNGYYIDIILRFKLNFESPNQIIMRSLGRKIMMYKEGDSPPADYILPNTMNFTLEKQ